MMINMYIHKCLPLIDIDVQEMKRNYALLGEKEEFIALKEAVPEQLAT